VEPTFDPRKATDPMPSDDHAPADAPAPLDPDFELLMSYVDGELTAAEAGRLEERLRGEPELADALGRMSAEHAVRQAVWRSLEPGQPEALSLAAGVTRSARRADWHRRFSRLSRVAVAAAACVALGFLAGWVGRGSAVARAVTSVEEASTTRPAVARRVERAEPRFAAKGAAKTGGGGAAAAAEPFVYQVALTDDDGNITAVQKFDNLDDARNFAADVGRWQARQQQIQEGHPVMTSSGL
jgi:anti-sigma factor RsiW